MMQSVLNRRGFSKSLTRTMFLCVLTAAFAVSAFAKSYFETDNTICQYSVNENFNEKQSSLSSIQNTYAAAAFVAPCNVAPDVIGGKAYRDFNFNGQQNGLEPGQAGIEVYLFTCDASNTGIEAATSVVTDANGEYVFTGLTAGQKYRVEFAIPESLDFLWFTTFGPENGTDVQFTMPGTCNISVGVGAEAEFHQDNPFLAVPCYINGSGAAGTESGDSLAFLAIQYDAQGENQNINLFTAKEVGALWGVSYERSTKTVFSSAVLRRHMGFGPEGTGAIYAMDVSDINNPSIAGVINLDALGVDTGTDPRNATTLPGVTSIPNHDTGAFALTAKMSIGDIDISDDGKTLYAVNLFTRELVTIDLTDYVLNGTIPGAAQVSATAIPAFNCDDASQWRPWALNFHNGDLYIGGICSAENSQDVADLTSTIVKYDGTNFTEYFTMPLDYQRGDPFNTDTNYENERNQWFPWSDDFTVIRTNDISGRFAYPQPILSDIEFDIDGSLILGFLDRTAQQGGFLNYGPDETSTTLYTTFSAGDMIRVCNVNGTLVLEGQQPECTNPIGNNWPQGPNGQEFYWEDQFPANPTGNRNRFVIHGETTLGALALLPGSGDVVATVYDPLGNVDAGGIAWFDNTTGARDRNYEVFVVEAGEGVGLPGKSNGLGDLELVCNQAPSEIGNYVWIDCNADGIQDACEDALPGVNVSLYKENGTLVATVTTDANGQYYFNSAVISASNTSADMDIESSTTYYIAFGTNGQYDNGTNILALNGENYQLTQANAGQMPNSDSNDSDAVAGDANAPAFAQELIAAVYVSPCTGFVDHTIDAGFTFGALILDITATAASCPDAADGVINAVAMANGGADVEYSLDNMTFQSTGVFTGLAAGSYTVFAQLVGGTSTTPECGGTTAATVEIMTGENPNAPVTTNFEICMNEGINTGQGLIATCEVCPSGAAAVVTWYDAAVGGTVVGTGSPFSPTVSTAISGETTFYAECSCGPCVSDRTPATLVVVDNPTPTILGENLLCPGSQETFAVEALNLEHAFVWEVIGTGLTIVGSNTEETVTVQVVDEPGAGPFQLKVTETGSTGTSCMGMDVIDVFVKETALACNDNVQVSLDINGCALITPDVILEGITGTGEGCYEVTITNQYGEAFGNKVTCENIGEVLTVNVASLCEDNSCWATIVLEDKLGPVITCPTGSTSIIPIFCSDDVNAILPPTAVDNCTDVSVVLSNETINDDDICSGVIITRTYIAIDVAGNISDIPCEQVIIIQQPDLPDFPEDIIWGCEQYSAYPNLTDATPLAPNIPDFNTTTEAIDVPFYISSTSLAQSGSGNVNVEEGLYCNYAVTHNDDTLSICTGLKIVRTWTVLNWCTGQLILEDANGNDNVQIIKVLDTQAPFIIGEDFVLTANNPGEHPQACTTTEMIPIPVLFDKCGSAYLSIYTEIGEAIYVNGVNGNDGASIPAPGLPIGFHTITFVAVDDCGNIRETEYELEVVDNVNPTPVCDEITDVVLNSAGVATVQALDFNDGSNDNCCIDRYEVKRLTEEDIYYSSEIEFNCSEAGDTVMIMMKVIDCYENSASCTIEVRVEDKEIPTCIAPSDITISCLILNENNIDISNVEDLEEEFGSATANDNCNDVYVEELSPITNFQGCGNGFVTRRFRSTDAFGNIGEICEQNILILYVPDYKLTFPADFEGSCGELPTEANVILESNGCDLIAVSHTDQVFNLSDDGACYKIIRRYQVVNLCTYDANLPTVEFSDSFSPMPGEMVDETTFNNAGHLTYTQTLKIVDNIAPVLSFVGETEFCVDDNCVTGPASLPIDIDENCTSDLDISWVLDAFDDDVFDGEFDTVGGGQFNGAAPLGTHRLRYTVEDGCGNAASYDITFEIKDCKAPVAYCNGGVIIDLMDTNPPMVQIWANDLDAGSFDNCGGEVTVSFSSNPLDTGMVFTCNQLGPNQVDVYFIDENGNFDYCSTQVIIQDNLLTNNGTPCVAAVVPVIAGTILTEMGEGLQGAMLELNGNNNVPVTTNESGVFTFNEVELDHDYSINSMHDVDHDNGVTTFDLTLIKSHILSINLLDSPYKMIAADANNSQSITTSDIVALRRLILTIDNELENNTSWRFVDASYEFPNPQDPWETGFPEVLNFNNFSESQLNADFTAIKIGDINGNAQANLTGNADERSTGEVLQFGVQNAPFKADENVTIDLTANDYKNISSYQFTFDFNTDALEFIGVKATEFSTAADFGMTHKEAGYITVAHYNEAIVELEDNTVVFSLEFKAKRAGAPSDFMEISSAKTTAIAYGATAETMNVELAFSSANEAFALYQNRPNPFTEATEIPFFLPTAGKAKLTVYDVSGKLMKIVESEYTAGYHQVAINRNELGAGSIFYYQLDTQDYSATRKMVLIK